MTLSPEAIGKQTSTKLVWPALLSRKDSAWLYPIGFIAPAWRLLAPAHQPYRSLAAPRTSSQQQASENVSGSDHPADTVRATIRKNAGRSAWLRGWGREGAFQRGHCTPGSADRGRTWAGNHYWAPVRTDSTARGHIESSFGLLRHCQLVSFELTAPTTWANSTKGTIEPGTRSQVSLEGEQATWYFLLVVKRKRVARLPFKFLGQPTTYSISYLKKRGHIFRAHMCQMGSNIKTKGEAKL